jgi:hypothetical protein
MIRVKVGDAEVGRKENRWTEVRDFGMSEKGLR